MGIYQVYKWTISNSVIKYLGKTKTDPGENYKQARELFLQLEHQLANNPEKWNTFHKVINTWLQEGFVTESPDICDGNYLVGFMVTRETSHGKTFPFILNGAREFHGSSINDHLLGGPNRMGRITEVLTRFCRYKFVLSCNIRHMFLGILVPLADQHYIKILYRKTPSDPLKAYVCGRHVFGLRSSPFIAMSTVI